MIFLYALTSTNNVNEGHELPKILAPDLKYLPMDRKQNEQRRRLRVIHFSLSHYWAKLHKDYFPSLLAHFRYHLRS